MTRKTKLAHTSRLQEPPPLCAVLINQIPPRVVQHAHVALDVFQSLPRFSYAIIIFEEGQVAPSDGIGPAQRLHVVFIH